MKISVLVICTLVFSNAAIAVCNKATPENSDFPESLRESGNKTGISTAWYDGATDRYSHGVLGDAIEPSILSVSSESDCTTHVELDTEHVFEDLAPRLFNIDGKPGAEVITIRSHQNYGAQIAVYQLINSTLTLLATTPYIGTSNRWLAPVGIADFNSDGDMDIAFIDRPHLAKTLRIWSFREGELQQIASKAGYSNHRIGEDFISGGIKACDGKITMITVDAYWNRILETSLQGDQLVSTDIGSFDGTKSLEDATQCQ